jgi:hypothetical protein
MNLATSMAKSLADSLRGSLAEHFVLFSHKVTLNFAMLTIS